MHTAYPSFVVFLGGILFSLFSFIYSPTTSANDNEVANASETSRKWVGKGYSIDGGWNITEENGKKILRFDQNFSTHQGPDLKVYLSRESLQNVKGRTVSQSSILISPLKSPKGAQEYELPASLNLDEFSSVLIHCETYAHLWGGGSLKNE